MTKTRLPLLVVLSPSTSNAPRIRSLRAPELARNDEPLPSPCPSAAVLQPPPPNPPPSLLPRLAVAAACRLRISRPLGKQHVFRDGHVEVPTQTSVPSHDDAL